VVNVMAWGTWRPLPENKVAWTWR